MAYKGISDNEAKALYKHAQIIIEIAEKAQQNYTREWEIKSYRDILAFNIRKKEIPENYYRFKLEEYEIWIEYYNNEKYRVYEKIEATEGKPHAIMKEEYTDFDNAVKAYNRLVKGTIEEKENGLC